MKSYNHLYEQFISDENYYLAVRNATKSKGKKKNSKRRKLAKYYREHPDKMKDSILYYAEHYHSAPHKAITIYDGIRRKQRNIIVPTVREQIVHHMIVNVMKPIFMKGMSEACCGSVPGRGAHYGKRMIEKWIRKDPKGVKYCLKMDISKYFESVPRKILKEKCARVIHDDRFLQVLYAVIDMDDSESGIPIGFYTSQWFANWFLNELDHYIKEELHAPHYARYVDDMVIFGPSKRKLHTMRRDIGNFLNSWLGIEMKMNYQVFRFSFIGRDGKETGRDLDFMGFRFMRNRTIIRKSIFIRMTRKARRLAKKAAKTIYECRQMLSYLGWIDHTDTYGAYLKHIKPFISFRYLKQRISRWQKQMTQKEALAYVNLVSCG